MAVILIGSTGNGKSTLGNFLLNPADDHLFTKQTFAIAQDNKPLTQHVKAATTEAETSRGKFRITLIDTPGLNESAVKDLEHMIGIVDVFKNLKEIKACIIVVKFNSKIDTQYKTTVKYYSELLHDLFEKNVIVVMTDYATDDRSVQIRKRQGIDDEQVKKNAVEEIVKCSGMTYEPDVFAMDCLPVNSDEQKISLDIRRALLDLIVTQKPTHVLKMRVAKTQQIRIDDEAQKKELEGEIIGYKERLEQAENNAKEALVALQAKEDEITQAVELLQAVESELNELDTDDLVVANSWKTEKNWKKLQSTSEAFTVKSKWEIVYVDKWTNGECEWKDYTQEALRVKGRLEGSLMRGIYATVKVYSSKKHKYKTEIGLLKKQVKKQKLTETKLEEECTEIREKYKEHEEEMKLLHDYIAKRRGSIKDLSSKYLTLDEARKRLQSMHD